MFYDPEECRVFEVSRRPHFCLRVPLGRETPILFFWLVTDRNSGHSDGMPTIRELAAGPERTGGGRRGLSGIAGDKVGSRNGQGEEISGPSERYFFLASQVKEQSN